MKYVGMVNIYLILQVEYLKNITFVDHEAYISKVLRWLCTKENKNIFVVCSNGCKATRCKQRLVESLSK